MKEALIILAVVVVLIGLTAFKYRRQIMAGVKVWRMISGLRDGSRSINEPPARQATSGRLLNCSKCGTWVAEERAVRLGQNTYFCSAACLEDVKAPRG